MTVSHLNRLGRFTDSAAEVLEDLGTAAARAAARHGGSFVRMPPEPVGVTLNVPLATKGTAPRGGEFFPCTLTRSQYYETRNQAA